MDDIKRLIESGDCAYWELENPNLLYHGSHLACHLFSFPWLPDTYFLVGSTSSSTGCQIAHLAFHTPSADLQHYNFTE